MSAPAESLATSSDLHPHEAVCRLERAQVTDPYCEDPTHLFLEPLGRDVWRLRVTAGQLALPAYQQ
jgi:hypothetical protein